MVLTLMRSLNIRNFKQRNFYMSRPKEELLKDRGKEPNPNKRQYDRHIIIEELLEWSLKDTSLNLVGFCAEHGYSANLLWTYDLQFEDFQEAYQLTKMRLAERRSRLLDMNMLNYGAWARYQKHYDPFLDKHEEEDKDKDAKRRKDIATQEGVNLATIVRMANEGKISQS